MPRIPTILANETLRGFPQPEAGADAFNPVPGLGHVAQGLYDFSSGMTTVARTLKQREGEVDARYVGDSYFQEVAHLSEWETQNSGSETYAQDFKKYAESRVKQYEDAAPSKSAKNEIRQRLQTAILSKYTQALGVTERTRMEKSKESVISQTSFAINSIRTMQGTSYGDPLAESESARAQIKEGVDRMFSTVDPEATRKIRGYVDGEFALSVAEFDKTAAMTILAQSEDLSQEQKLLLSNKVEMISRVSDSVMIDDTQRARRDQLAAVASGATSEKLPIEAYGALPDPGHEKREDDRKIDILVGINKAVDKVSGLNSDAQNRELGRLKGEATTDMGRQVYLGAREKIADIQELQEKDRVAWLMSYNPEVKKLTEWANEAMDGSTLKEVRLEQLDEAMLKYQGEAPLGAIDPDAYLGLASNDRQLMTMQQAKEGAAYINQGSQKEIVSRIEQLLARHPDKDHQYTAFANLVNMPGADGIKQEYQLVWQNKDQWWIGTFINALADSKSFGQLDEVTKGKLDSEISDNMTWKKFHQAMVGPDGSRAKEIAGFKSGISMYANYFKAQGDDLSTAADKSVDALLNTTMAFTAVNGRPLMIPRQKSDGQSYRTDDEIEDIGERRLPLSMKYLDPREIDQSRFIAIQQLGPEDNVGKMQALRDDLTRNAYFVTDDDGQHVTLYMPGDRGIPFQVRDRSNRAFQIKIDDLPMMWNKDPSFGESFLGTFTKSAGEPLKDKPDAKYPIRQETGPGVKLIDRLLGIDQKRTHWPVTADFWKRKVVESKSPKTAIDPKMFELPKGVPEIVPDNEER